MGQDAIRLRVDEVHQGSLMDNKIGCKTIFKAVAYSIAFAVAGVYLGVVLFLLFGY